VAAAIAIIYQNDAGGTLQWEYDDVALTVTDLRAINPPGAPPLHIFCQVTGKTVATQTIPPSTNTTVLLPQAPSLTQDGTTGNLTFSIDFIGGSI